MKIVLIDNYDSFTYILAQYLDEQPGVQLTILKNDSVKPTQLADFDGILISPGPGLPEDAGSILDIIRMYSGKKFILGVCLGLQAIYEVFGGSLLNLEQVRHGVSSNVIITDPTDPILMGINSPFEAGRYHSWICDRKNLPEELMISAIGQDDVIMACRHKEHHTYGVQFHPESILTPTGKKMIENFVRLCQT